MRRWMVLGGLFGFSLAAWGQASVDSTGCERLSTLKLEGAKVTSAVMVADAAALAALKLDPGSVRGFKSFCRVQILDQPSADSTIRTEVWLPAAGWNGRLSTRGNGGFAGQIYYDQMAAAVSQGYATAGTDTGHSEPTSGFALGHPEKVKDFGWRAIHDMTVEAKAVVAAFYGRPQSHAYFAACSDGGREALMEAQRFPADYDGILAGAPAYDWTALLSGAASDAKALGASPGSYIPPQKLPAIATAVRNACDAQDGVKDGILNDPLACRFDPAALVCKDGDADSCLLPAQVATLKKIYSAKVDEQGRTVYPGFLPGAEDARGSWVPWKVQQPGAPTLLEFFSAGYFRDFVKQDEAWQLGSFDLAADYNLARAKTGADLDASDPNLKPFSAHGGRLILYHGWDDPAIAAPATIEYYKAVRSSVGERATDEAVRLYLVPGMLHCSGGPGATDFGQDAGMERGDAEHDVLTALEQWVEAGKAPGKVVAKGKTMTRPLCVYPAEAKYVGGDTKDAASFACTARVHE